MTLPVIQHVQPPEVLGVADITPERARWLRFKVLKLKDEAGREYDWEFVERVTKYRETDGVGVFAKVVAKDQPDRLLVIAQWRPAVQTFVIELPAGVIEGGETTEDVAKRELLEETGYSGVINLITPETTNEQAVCNSCINFAIATVDAAAPENANPVPSPELGETLQVLLLPLKGLSDALFKLKKEHSWQIDSRLATFALGLEFSHN